MKPCLIVGGGIAGLLAAKILKLRDIPFLGLEVAERLGGRTAVGHHRLYEKGSIEFFRLYFPEVEFDFIDESPLERKKGNWEAPKEQLRDEEQFYMGQSFYFPRTPYSKIIDQLSSEVGDKFTLRTHLVEIHHAEKRAVASTGAEVEYSQLIWCAPLEALPKVWSDDKTVLTKAMKQLEVSPGGLNLEMELSKPLFPNRNTVVFPFRYKEYKLRALGTGEPVKEEGNDRYFVHWLLMLEEEIADDREEVAKCVRALKRELLKEFPEIAGLLKKERIVFLSKIAGEKPVTVKSLSLVPDLIYLGAQVRLPNSKEEPRNLDRILDNCLFFSELIASARVYSQLKFEA